MFYQKQYYQDNKEHIKELVRNRYKTHKDLINKKITCPDCGRVVIARMYKKHLTTNIHLKPKTKKNIITDVSSVYYNDNKFNKKHNDGWITFK